MISVCRELGKPSKKYENELGIVQNCVSPNKSQKQANALTSTPHSPESTESNIDKLLETGSIHGEDNSSVDDINMLLS